MKTQRKILTTLLLGVFMLFGSAITVKAATVTQTAQTQDSITITFDSALSASNVLSGWTVSLQQYDDSFNKVDVIPATPVATNVNTYTFSGLRPGTRYFARVDYSYTYKSTSSSLSGKSYSSYTSKEIYTMPGKVTNVNQTTWWYYAKSVDFGWDKQDACKYEWIAKQGKKTVAQSSYASSTNSANFKIKNNKLYTVQVRAYTDINGQTVYGEWSDKAYLFTQPMIINKKGGISIDGSGRMHVKWEKIDGVDGYDVYVSTKEKSGYKKVAKIKKGSKNTATIKKFKKKKFSRSKTYFVYVVAKKKINGVVNTSGRHYSTKYKNGSIQLMWSFSDRR